MAKRKKSSPITASRDIGYKEAIKEVRSQGVFALNPDDITTPIRMAPFAHASNARTAKEVPVEVKAAAKLGTHQLLTVGDFFRALQARKAKRESE